MVDSLRGLASYTLRTVQGRIQVPRKGGCLGSACLRAPRGGCGRGMCPLPREARKLLDLHICRVQGGSFLDSILMLTTKILNNTTM